jgi:hypothetical protein
VRAVAIRRSLKVIILGRKSHEHATCGRNGERAMNHYQLISRVVLSTTLVVGANVSTSHGDFYDPFGMQVHEHPLGQNGPELTYPNVGRWSNVLSGREPLDKRVARRVSPSNTARFDDVNLSITMPSGTWTKLDPKKSGSHAFYIITRENPKIVISLAGDRVGAESGATNQSLLAESQAKIKGRPGAGIEPGERQLSAGGIEGLAYGATIVDGETTTHYSIWVAAHHGYNYKVAAYGNEKDKSVIDAALLNFVHGIKHIEPTKIARTDGKPTTSNVKVAERNHNRGRQTR